MLILQFYDTRLLAISINCLICWTNPAQSRLTGRHTDCTLVPPLFEIWLQLSTTGRICFYWQTYVGAGESLTSKICPPFVKFPFFSPKVNILFFGRTSLMGVFPYTGASKKRTVAKTVLIDNSASKKWPNRPDDQYSNQPLHVGWGNTGSFRKNGKSNLFVKIAISTQIKFSQLFQVQN